MTAPSGPTSTAPASSPVAVGSGRPSLVALTDRAARDAVEVHRRPARDAHRAAIRALPPGLVPLDVLLSLVRDDVPTGTPKRIYRAPWTERDESSARSCSTPRTHSALIAGVRR